LLVKYFFNFFDLILGRTASVSQLVFWLIISLSQGLTMGSVIMDGEAKLTTKPNVVEKILSSLLFTFCLGNLFGNCFTEKKSSKINGKAFIV